MKSKQQIFILILSIFFQTNIFTSDNQDADKKRYNGLFNLFYSAFVSRKKDLCVKTLIAVRQVLTKMAGMPIQMSFKDKSSNLKFRSNPEDAKFFEEILIEFEKTPHFDLKKIIDEQTILFDIEFKKRNLNGCLKIFENIENIYKSVGLKPLICINFEKYFESDSEFLLTIFRSCEENGMSLVTLKKRPITDSDKKMSSEKDYSDNKKKNKRVRSKKQLIIYDKYGRTELQNAVRNGNLEQVIAYLKGNGSIYFDVLTKDSKLHVLHYAVDRCQNISTDESKKILEELVKFAKKNNKSLDVLTSNGYTPLHLAAYNGNLEVVELLSKNDADYRLLTFGKDNKDGFSAKKLAQDNGHSEVFDYLNALESPD